MQKTKTSKIPSFLRTLLWILLIQFLLVNISASIYAYKFTHFETDPHTYVAPKNIFEKTWRLFVGPRMYRQQVTEMPSFPFTTVRFSASGNIPVEGWYGKKDSAKACVILLHGLMASKSGVLKEATRLHHLGYNVLLFDFRGHGNSGGTKTTFGMAETDEVVQAYRYAQAAGNRKIILYGISMGASIAIRTAAEGGIRPAAIVADMPFASLQDHLKGRARSLGFPPQPFGFLLTFWIGVENGYNGFAHRTDEAAESVACPVLLQWGEQDHLVLPGEINRIYSALPPALRHRKGYSEAGHQSLLDSDPDLWMRTVIPFIDSVKA